MYKSFIFLGILFFASCKFDNNSHSNSARIPVGVLVDSSGGFRPVLNISATQKFHLRVTRRGRLLLFVGSWALPEIPDIPEQCHFVLKCEYFYLRDSLRSAGYAHQKFT